MFNIILVLPVELYVTGYVLFMLLYIAICYWLCIDYVTDILNIVTICCLC